MSVTPVGRRCVTCGAAEQRTADKRGREATNICSITGECVDCLVKSSKDTLRLAVAKRGVIVRRYGRTNLVRRGGGLSGRDLAVPIGDRD